MGERRSFPHRVFIEDARGGEQILRVTWHRQAAQFVVSQWRQDVCVAATRVEVADVPTLMALLANGLADAATGSTSREPLVASPPAGGGLRAWWRRWRGRGHAAERGVVADLVELPATPPIWARPQESSRGARPNR